MKLRFNEAGIWQHKCRHCGRKFFPSHNGIYLCSDECRAARLVLQRKAALERWRARKKHMPLTNRQRGARNRAVRTDMASERICLHCGAPELDGNQSSMCPQRESAPHQFTGPTQEARCEE